MNNKKLKLPIALMALTMLGANTVTNSPARMESAVEGFKTTNVKRANEVSKWDETFVYGMETSEDEDSKVFINFKKNVPIDLEGQASKEVMKLFGSVTGEGNITQDDS